MNDFNINSTLVNEIKAGNSDAFEFLYKKYYSRLCAFSAQYVSVDEAQEVVADSMMWLWENRDKLLYELQIKSYLFTIVKNRSLNQARHKSIKYRTLEIFKEKYKDEFEEPDFYTLENLKSTLYKALSKLPNEYRDAFEMNRFRGFSYDKIAAMKGVSAKTIAYRISQTIKALRVELVEFSQLILFLLIYL